MPPLRKELQIKDCTLRQWPSDRTILDQVKGFVERAGNVYNSPQLVSVEFLHCRMKQENPSRCYASRIKQHKTLKRFLETQYMWGCLGDDLTKSLDWGYEIFESSMEYIKDPRYAKGILPHLNMIRKGSPNGALLVSYPNIYSHHFIPSIRHKFWTGTQKAASSPADRLHAVYHSNCARPSPSQPPPPPPPPQQQQQPLYLPTITPVTAVVNGNSIPSHTPSPSSSNAPRAIHISVSRASKISNDIENHFKSSIPDEQVAAKRERLVTKITNMLRNEYPGLNLRVEISSANGLDFKHSDLDLCIIVPQQQLQVDKRYNIGRLSKLAGSYYNMRFLRKKLNQIGMKNVQAVPNASVPICKFEDPRLNIKCDINTANDMGVENSKFLRTYAHFDPRVRPFLYALKHFTKRRHINNAAEGTLSSYTYVLMALFYLMQCDPPVIPNLQKLDTTGHQCHITTCRSYQGKKKLTVHKKEVVQFDVSYHTCVTAVNSQAEMQQTIGKATGWFVKNKQSVGDLLVGFFVYYDDFDFKTKAISLFEGKPIQRRPAWNKHEIVVQDPFIRDRNVAASCTDSGFMTVLEEFFRALLMFTGDGNIFDPSADGNSFAEVCAKQDKDRHRNPSKLSIKQRIDALAAEAEAAALINEDYDDDDGVAEQAYEREMLSEFINQVMEYEVSAVMSRNMYNRHPNMPRMGYPASFTLAGLTPHEILSIESALDPFGGVVNVEEVYTKQGEREIRVLVDLDEDETPEEIEFEMMVLERVGRPQVKKGKYVARYEPIDYLF
ncbi:hypothetical protein K492DRAFT_194751 [Lichtheimia hyalospora FSU 10163]|nr:hypothetical protein K492DRAFT_194751 [Lichtheimia hyalospora FSU 10163]